MCGIAGYFGLTEDKALLKRMNDAQHHRGPDGEGVFAEGLAGLGHRRLAIIDRAHGQEPLFSADKNLVITYNGEVYNYRELREELKAKGYEFKTESDTEVIVQAYAAWGTKAFDKFNGMFAFAIYDRKAKKLVLARDHFGIKPLYFANIGSVTQPQVFFASEVKALLATQKVPARPNDRIIYRYLRYRIHDDSAETFFDGIYTLQPGECITITKDSFKLSPYTNLQAELATLAKERRAYTPEVIREYRERFTQAVQMRLVSEVPVATCLSGGMDSTAVTLIMNRLFVEHDKTAQAVGTTQNTFSAVFPGSINDEEKYVDAVMDVCKGDTRVYKVYPTAEEFRADIRDFVRTQEEPTIATAQYAQYKVMQEASKHVTVLLDGQGADEMLTGYYPYFLVYLRQLKRQKRWFKLVLEVIRSSDILFRAIRFKLLDALQLKRKVNASQLLADNFKARWHKESYHSTPDDLRTRFIEDIFHNSLQSLLRYEDRNSMRFSLEGRVPFLDKEVTKFLFSLNEDAIILNGWNKRIVRDALKDILPPLVARRRNKVGFTTPEVEWFKTLADDFREIFESASFAARPYFNQGQVIAEFESFINDRSKADSLLFWRMINIELWLREFIDPHQPTNQAPDQVPNIKVKGRTYQRFPVQTKMITASDELSPVITGSLRSFFAQLGDGPKQTKTTAELPWYLFVSEKPIAITQGRSYFVWDIKPGLFARLLSRFVVRTPHEAGLGSPWAMQLAIRQAGLPRILLAAAVSVFGKIFGHKGWFYIVAGADVRAIDGPAEYAKYPNNVSARLPVQNPQAVAEQLSAAIKKELDPAVTANFRGVVVIEATPAYRNVLGHNVVMAADELEEIFADNPLSQSNKPTPLCVVFDKEN